MLIPARTDTQYWHDHVMKVYLRFVLSVVVSSLVTRQIVPFPSAVVFRHYYQVPCITGMERL